MVLDRGFEPTVFDVRGRLPKPTRRIEHKILIDRDHIPALTAPFIAISIKMVRRIKY